MKAVGGVAALAAAAVLSCWAGAARAYRPFDGTDAAVAETGEVEIELGPVEYLRDGAERTLFAPDLRVNYGFAADWEASLEGEVAHGLTAGTPGTSLVEGEALSNACCARAACRRSPGPVSQPNSAFCCRGSMTNMGLEQSLPASPRSAGTGRTVHLNAQIALTREQHADYFLDTIIEGPHDWVVRPVSEVFYERDVGQFRTRSALIGAIWQVQDNIAVDLRLRGARVNDHTAGEIRAGVTFAFGVTKGPDILSGLFAMALHGIH